MHICYLHIFSFSILKDIGLTFDHRFDFEMSEEALYVTKRKKAIPEGFWGNGIYSLTAIVGENGSGKSTALRLMKRLLIEGAPYDDGIDVLIVYEQRGELYVYHSTTPRTIIGAQGIKIHTIQDRECIETLYYSGHFEPFIDSMDLELAGSFDASDGWLLIKDLQDYANVDTLHLNQPLKNHLRAYYAQNHYRICELLLLDGLQDLLQTVRLPKYITFNPNLGGWDAIQLDRTGRYKNVDIPNAKYTQTDNAHSDIVCRNYFRHHSPYFRQNRQRQPCRFPKPSNIPRNYLWNGCQLSKFFEHKNNP